MLYNTGLKNCTYKVSGSLTRKPLTGAQKISFASNSAERTISVRTDKGAVAYSDTIETGKTATLEIVQLPVDFLVDVLGYDYTNGILTEKTKHKATHFSLYYEVQTDTEPQRVQIFDCVCAKPDFDVTTITNTPSVDIKKLKLLISPEKTNIGISDNYSRSTSHSENATAFDTWFSTISEG